MLIREGGIPQDDYFSVNYGAKSFHKIRFFSAIMFRHDLVKWTYSTVTRTNFGQVLRVSLEIADRPVQVGQMLALATPHALSEEACNVSWCREHDGPPDLE